MKRLASRIVIALGGNAISPHGSQDGAADQAQAIARAMYHVAVLVEHGWSVVLTHGNGPQVGNVLAKNELARDVLPPAPLDWCVAQTQATIGFTIANALEERFTERRLERSVVALVSRVLVSLDDPAWNSPTKPIGRFLNEEEVRRYRSARASWIRDSDRGYRRVVPSPEPLRSLDARAIRTLLETGAVVVANGGGGIPVARQGTRLQGVEAVVDKDLAGALLAKEVWAEQYVVLTDVPGVALGYGTSRETWLGEVTVAELRKHLESGEFPPGSMLPKVQAVVRFVESTGGRAAIAGLDDVVAAVAGERGTRVRP